MVSVLVEDLPPATVELFESRARRAGAASVTEHVRHELITLARERAPIDNVVEFAQETPTRRAQPDVDHDAQVMSEAYGLPADVWNTFCLRAAASDISVSDYAYNELVALSRRSSIDDIMWEFEEAKNADPSLDIDLEAIRKATLYARGED
jgi:hypothetical protein